MRAGRSSRTSRSSRSKRAGPTKTRRSAPLVLSARLNGRLALQVAADGSIAASFDGYAIPLGRLSAGAAKRAEGLRTGLPLKSFAAERSAIEKEINLLVRRMARQGLLEYPLVRDGAEIVVIEPQTADYWPELKITANSDTLALSRFAYLRRRGGDMVLESPRGSALFRICGPQLASALAALATPQKFGALRRQGDFPGREFFALLFACDMVFKVDATDDDNLRAHEGDQNLVQWDFHDLLFHTHSTEGRQANPIGGRFAYLDAIPPPPAVRPPWPGDAIDLKPFSAASDEALTPFAKLLRERHSTRDFDEQSPIRLAELARLLDHAARVQFKWTSPLDLGDGSFGPEIYYTRRPYPSAGSAYELELYLAVGQCEGLARGFYHYDADRHALVPIEARAELLEALLAGATFAMDAPTTPQILVTIAARFDRIAWKYSAIAYSLILKDVGVLLQTLYLAATDLDLGGCAIGTNNIDLFAKLTGEAFHVEGPVGLFALGRGRPVGTGP
jgi:SagB-type dehydrogenase family enzyme